ncbi:MAG: GNAT family N-acetyltransferase [Firmicutes bacterium]|nr:GNAT family N-acetyltransferase [Bacillota bacterium]
MIVENACEAQRKEIRELWDICFGEDKDFNEYFFENRFRTEETLVLKENGKIVSMLQRFRYELYNVGKVSYIYGACTHPEYRKKHYMAHLLEKSREADIKEELVGSVLVPQEEWLFGFYERYGFGDIFRLEEKYEQKSEDHRKIKLRAACGNDITTMNDIYEKMTGGCAHIRRSGEEWKRQMDMFKSLGGEVYISADEDSYCFVWNTEEIWIQEIFAEENKKDMINEVMDIYGKERAKVTEFSEKKGKRFAAARMYDVNISGGYVNLMYN